jgi:hypothetical protein
MSQEATTQPEVKSEGSETINVKVCVSLCICEEDRDVAAEAPGATLFT